MHRSNNNLIRSKPLSIDNDEHSDTPKVWLIIYLSKADFVQMQQGP